MPLDHFRHQRIHRAPAGGDVMQNVGALGLLIESSLDGFHLTSDTPYPIEQFLLFFDRMCHKMCDESLYKYTPAGIP
jgi:hypothetical protein